MEPKPLVERWAEGEPTVAYSIEVPAVVDPDAWVIEPAQASETGPASEAEPAPLGIGPALGWYDALDTSGRHHGLDGGLIGSIVQLGRPTTPDTVAEAVAVGRYPPLGTRPWVSPTPAPTDPVRHRAVANEMLAAVLALADAAWLPHLDSLVALDGVDGLLVRRDPGVDLAELEDAVIDVCDAAGLTPGVAFGSNGVAAADARAVDQAHALGFGFVVVLAPGA